MNRRPGIRMNEEDVRLGTQLFEATIVAGIRRVRIRRNPAGVTPCKATHCLEGSGFIPAGARIVRVNYDDGRGREEFHIDCYRNEFIA